MAGRWMSFNHLLVTWVILPVYTFICWFHFSVIQFIFHVSFCNNSCISPHWIVCITILWYIPGYFCTVCIAVRCAGPFWYSYRIFQTSAYRATRVLFCNQSTLHYKMLFSHCLALSLARFDFEYLSSLKCKRGTFPPCSKQMYIMYISYCCVVLKKNLNGLLKYNSLIVSTVCLCSVKQILSHAVT